MKKVSITIPCLNEEKYIGKCLDSIINSTYPKEFLSVFVVDGESSDRTLSILQEYKAKYPFIHVLNNPEKITPISLNIGIKAEKVDVAIILGAHAEIYPDYIEQCLQAFENAPNIGCTGGVLEQINEDHESEIIAKAMSSPFGVGNAHFRTGLKDGFVDTVAFGAYKKEVFEAIGYFDEELARNQDDEFNYRLVKNGFQIYLSKSIRAKYYVRASYKKLYRQYYQYGFWKVLVNKKHQAVTSVRQMIPPLFVASSILGILSALFLPFLGFPLMSFWLIYLIGALYFANKVSNGSSLFGICYVFLILHLAYGCGYLKGIFHFLILNKTVEHRHQKLTR